MPKHQNKQRPVTNHKQRKSGSEQQNMSNKTETADIKHLSKMQRYAMRQYKKQQKFFGNLMEYKHQALKLESEYRRAEKHRKSLHSSQLLILTMAVCFILAGSDANYTSIGAMDYVIGGVFVVALIIILWKQYYDTQLMTKLLHPMHIAETQRQICEFYNDYMNAQNAAKAEKRFLISGVKSRAYKTLPGLQKRMKYYHYFTAYIKDRNRAMISSTKYRMAKHQLHYYNA